MFIFKAVRAFAITVIVVFALAWAGTIYIHYPSPLQTARLGLAKPSDTPTLMPANYILPAMTPIEWPTAYATLPNTVTWYGKKVSLSTFLTATHTNAFLVVRNGAITFEWYVRRSAVTEFLASETQAGQARQLPSYSVAKTIVAIAAGELIKEGKLHETDTFVSFFPEFKTGTAYDQITVGQLLDMRSGVDVPDDYPTGPSGWGAPISQMYATTDLMNFIHNHRGLAFTPGSKAIYRSVDTQMLGMIIAKASGESLSKFVEEHLWNSVGAEYQASWNVDHDGGYVKSFCCLNAAARDYAKIGQLMIDGGAMAGVQVIDPKWMTRLTTPVEQMKIGTKNDHWGYGAFVWHPFPDTNLMLGLHDQFVFMVPDKKTVIVKLSDNTQTVDEVETAKVLHELALAN